MSSSPSVSVLDEEQVVVVDEPSADGLESVVHRPPSQLDMFEEESGGPSQSVWYDDGCEHILDLTLQSVEAGLTVATTSGRGDFLTGETLAHLETLKQSYMQEMADLQALIACHKKQLRDRTAANEVATSLSKRDAETAIQFRVAKRKVAALMRDAKESGDSFKLSFLQEKCGAFLNAVPDVPVVDGVCRASRSSFDALSRSLAALSTAKRDVAKKNNLVTKIISDIRRTVRQ